MAVSRIEAVAGLRVSEAAFEDGRRAFTIIGSLEFGRVPDGLDVRLPLPGGEYFYASIVAVQDLESPPGIARIAVSVLAVEVGEERLERLSLAGEQLQLVRRIFEPSDYAGQDSGPDRIRADEVLATVGTVGRSILGTLGLLILAAAFILPPVLSGSFNGNAIAWMIVGGAAFIGGVALLNSSVRWSFPVLILACLVFFTSCAANLKLHLD